MRRIEIVLWCLIFSLIAAFAFAENAARVIPLSSDCYALMDALYMETGMVPPDQARPWTVSEFVSALERLDAITLSRAGNAAYREIEAELNPSITYAEKHFSFRTDPNLNPEAFAHVNLGRDSAATDWDYTWMHGYEERAPLLDVPLEFLFGDRLYMLSDLAFKEEPNTVQSGLNVGGTEPAGVLNNYMNLLFDDPEPRLDIYFPFRAFFSAAGDFWSVKLGRDKASWGNGVSGNMMLSDYSDYYDMLNVAFFGKNFKLSSIYIVMDPFLPDGMRQAYSAFMGHRFDIRIIDRVQLAINESVVFGGSLDPELTRDTNFMMVFHNWMEPERTNSLMTVEVSYDPWKYMDLYAQVAMDEFETTYEAERGGGGGPPIFGYIAGARGAVPLGLGYLDACLEWALTSPWLYNRASAPYYYNVRRYWSLTTDRFEYITKPIGYKYGPDSIAYFLSVDYKIPKSLEAGLEATYVQQGEKTIKSAWAPAVGDIAPTGIVETTIALSLDASYPVFRWLSARGGVNFSFISNRDHIVGAYSRDMELYAGVSLTLP